MAENKNIELDPLIKKGEKDKNFKVVFKFDKYKNDYSFMVMVPIFTKRLGENKFKPNREGVFRLSPNIDFIVFRWKQAIRFAHRMYPDELEAYELIERKSGFIVSDNNLNKAIREAVQEERKDEVCCTLL